LDEPPTTRPAVRQSLRRSLNETNFSDQDSQDFDKRHDRQAGRIACTRTVKLWIVLSYRGCRAISQITAEQLVRQLLSTELHMGRAAY